MKLNIIDGPYTITGRGLLYVVTLPPEMSKEDIVGQEFEVGGERRPALGVERFRTTWRHHPLREVGILFGDPV